MNESRRVDCPTEQEIEEMDVHNEQSYPDLFRGDAEYDEWRLGVFDNGERASSLDGDTAYSGIFRMEEEDPWQEFEEPTTDWDLSDSVERFIEAESRLLQERWRLAGIWPSNDPRSPHGSRRDPEEAA